MYRDDNQIYTQILPFPWSLAGYHKTSLIRDSDTKPKKIAL